MGQKTHPIGFRLGSTRTWSSRWFATKNYADLLHEDVKIRRFIKDQLYHAGIAKIDIERSANRARITIFTARPGIIIGRKGAEVEKLKNELQARTGERSTSTSRRSSTPSWTRSSCPRTSRCSCRSAWPSGGR